METAGRDATALFQKPHHGDQFPEKEIGEQDTDLPHRIVHQHVIPASACAEQSVVEDKQRADRQRMLVRGFDGGRYLSRRAPCLRREIYLVGEDGSNMNRGFNLNIAPLLLCLLHGAPCILLFLWI